MSHMSWFTIGLLAVFSYAFKALGFTVVGGRELRGVAAEAVRLLPAALLSALVVVGTVSTAQSLGVDARLVGISFAGVATWRRWPFTVIVVGAAVITALVRLLAG